MKVPQDNPWHKRESVTSQWGEDGIIKEIFRRMGTRNKYCVEFGAWDGKQFSNTWDLWHNKGWSALLIEGDRQRCEAVQRDVAGFEKVQACNAFVAVEGKNSLDTLMTRFDVPRDVDLVSIDIDSDDYSILASLQHFQPRLTIVEFNPTIPPELEIVQARGEYFGASARALVKLARKKGYLLVCCTETNCFFVREEDFPRLEMEEPVLEEIFPRENLRYVITSYDGMPFLDRPLPYALTLPKVPRFNVTRRAGKPHTKLADSASIVPVRIFEAEDRRD